MQSVKQTRRMSSNQKWTSRLTNCQNIPMAYRKTPAETHAWSTFPASTNYDSHINHSGEVGATEIETVAATDGVEIRTQSPYLCQQHNHNQELNLHTNVKWPFSPHSPSATGPLVGS